MPKVTRAMIEHLDAELRDTIALAAELERPTGTYPEHVWRAMRLAFAAHYRVLMEFFHDGRSALKLPVNTRMSKRDVRVSDLIPPGRQFPVKATKKDRQRFQAADKLAAHLARDRSRYHAGKEEWGSHSDQHAIVRRARRLLGLVPRGTLPLTAAALTQ